MSDNKQNSGNVQPAVKADTAIDTALKHLETSTQYVMNMQWQDADYHLDRAEAQIAKLPDEERVVLSQILLVLRKMALGLQAYVEAKTSDDLNVSLTHLNEAKQTLLDLAEGASNLVDTPGYRQMQHGLEMQIVSLSLNIAERLGDTSQIGKLKAQRNKALEDAIADLLPDDPMRYYIEGLKLWIKTQPIIAESSSALVRLDLDSQLRYLDEARGLLQQAQGLFDRLPTNDILLEAPRKLGRGLNRLLAAQEAYAHVLYAAITGDVTRPDIEQLKAADGQFAEAGQLITEAAPAIGELSLNLQAVKSSIDLQRDITRNLRRLCEQSLSPKEISRSASPRVAIYFVGTFLVLLLALRLSGLIGQLDLAALGFLILMSFLASLIGTFGFEALRFVPLLETIKGFFSSKPAA